MPLTTSGEKVQASMIKEYGAKKGKQVFFASINKGTSGSSKWHRSSTSRSRRKGR